MVLKEPRKGSQGGQGARRPGRPSGNTELTEKGRPQILEAREVREAKRGGTITSIAI